MKKICLTFLLSLLLVFSPSAVTYAAETDSPDSETDTEEESGGSTPSDMGDDSIFDYNGEIDMMTGEPVVDRDGNSNKTIVRLDNGVSFNRDTKRFVYQRGEAVIETSVADGMITTGKVSFKYTNPEEFKLYKDGKLYKELPDQVTDLGSYTFVSNSNNNGEQLITFRIVGSTTGEISQYVLPDGFVVKNITLDGEEQRSEYGTVDLSKEGYYVIEYTNNEIGVTYTLTLNMDHTPPEVTFEGLDENDRANGPVTVTGLTKNDTVKVIYEDEESHLNMKDQVTETGYYTITVTDRAGNTVSKDFRILLYITVKTWVLFGVTLLIFIGVGVALYITRKRLRVR